jgi:hypothetical protein
VSDKHNHPAGNEAGGSTKLIAVSKIALKYLHQQFGKKYGSLFYNDLPVQCPLSDV